MENQQIYIVFHSTWCGNAYFFRKVHQGNFYTKHKILLMIIFYNTFQIRYYYIFLYKLCLKNCCLLLSTLIASNTERKSYIKQIQQNLTQLYLICVIVYYFQCRRFNWQMSVLLNHKLNTCTFRFFFIFLSLVAAGWRTQAASSMEEFRHSTSVGAKVRTLRKRRRRHVVDAWRRGAVMASRRMRLADYCSDVSAKGVTLWLYTTR